MLKSTAVEALHRSLQKPVHATDSIVAEETDKMTTSGGRCISLTELQRTHHAVRLVSNCVVGRGLSDGRLEGLLGQHLH